MQRPANKSAAIVLALVMLLPVVYVLSAGPAYWLALNDSIAPKNYDRFYAPLIWAGRHSNIWLSALCRYQEWWVPSAPPY